MPLARIPLPLAFLLLAAIACVPTRPSPVQLGIRWTEDEASLEIRYGLCEGERIESVEVVAPRGFVINDGNDRVIWRITSSGSTVTSIRVGSPPSGFRETVPFTPGSIQMAERLAVIVDTSQTQASVIFEGQDVERERILTDEGPIEPASFEARARETCLDD